MSSINPNNIDGTYPIAGQDNDSQGFRDNFTNIKNNLTFAKTEIEDVQAKGIFKTALSGTTLDNELSDTIISGAQLLKYRETINELGSLSGTVTVDWADAHLQTLTLDTGNITLALTGWPTSGRHTKLRLWIDVQDKTRTLTLPSVVTVGATDLVGCVITAGVPTISFTEENVVYVYEFTSYDNGSTVAVEEITRNRSTRVSDYQYLTPANNSIANVSPTVSSVVIVPAGTIALANIRMPGNTQVVDGQTVAFAFGATITAVTHYGNGATILGGITTANVSAGAKYIYKTSTNSWYKLG